MMTDNTTYLAHHGVKGQKWGVIRSKRKTTGTGKTKKTSLFGKRSAVMSKKKTATAKKKSSSTKKSVKDMTDEELKKSIDRLELERKYNSLSPQKVSKGKDFIAKVIEKSGENIATQLTTYAMGTAVNKIAGSEIVNPKKGQKDK